MVALPALADDSLRDQQLRFPRVREAVKRHGDALRALFEAKKLPWPPRGIFVRAFKKDAQLELWGRAAKGDAYELVKSYPICASSGDLGPKRQAGDGQVPEGFYYVKVFNPTSNFHLSLGLDYPNASDRALGAPGKLGGDIFIHGSCVTIGCMPLTDPLIEEVYVAAVEARSAGQERISVHVFPTRLTDENLRALVARAGTDAALAAFWTNLKEGFDRFESTHVPPRVEVDGAGRYVVR